MSTPFELKIENIFGGQSAAQYFSSKGGFNSSIAIDPDYPDVAGSIKTSGFAVPIGYAEFSGSNVTARPIAIINNPKNTLTYVVLSNGRLISYNSSLASETLIGTVTGGEATGGWYYNNYIYITTPTNISRYGPLNNSPSLTNTWWTGAGLTALTDTTYPSFRGRELPIHWGAVHGDGASYFCDFINGQGMIHKIKTSKTTDEGDTNNGSAYNSLDLPFGYYPMSLCSYGTDLAIVAFRTVDTTVNQGDATMFLWDTTNTDSFYKEVPLDDPIATAILNVGGTPFIWSGNANNGVRLTYYAGGETIKEVVYQEEGTPPFPGAVCTKGNKIFWGGWTTYPSATASVFSINSKHAKLSSATPIHNIAKATSSGANQLVTALRPVQQSSNIQPKLVIGWVDDSADGLDQYSATGTLASMMRWGFIIGNRFEINYVRIPFAGAVAANTGIAPKFYFDDESSNKTPTAINNTNYPSKRKVIYKAPELKDYTGENNFIFEMTWSSTNPLTVAWPIIIKGLIYSDEDE